MLIKFNIAGSESSRRPPHGFTLIELLVVIAIIAILATILLPTLAQAKKLAKNAKCLSTLKNTATTVSLYRSDNNDNFWPIFSPIDVWPPTNYWFSFVNAEYIEMPDFFICDIVKDSADPAGFYAWTNPDDGLVYTCNYSYNQNLTYYTYGDILYPAKTWLLSETYHPLGWIQIATTHFYTMYTAHNGGANGLFVDGHASWIEQPSDTSTLADGTYQ